jgi:O-antigen ligase
MATPPLVFTLSRGGWIMLFVGAAVVLVAGRRRISKGTVALVLAGVLVLAIAFGGAIQKRLSGDDNGSAAARMPLNRLAMAMIEDHPVMGVGANNFATAMPPYLPRFTGDFVYTVHNRYLLVWAETGIFGLIAFVWFLTAVLREGWKAWRAGTDTLSPVALGCMAAVAALVVQMNIDISRCGAEIQLLWVFGGVAAAINSLQRDRPLVIVRRNGR